jgi:hypothetical protein
MTTLACDYCGDGVEDTPEANVWHGLLPYPGDPNTIGMCRKCGGDPTAKTTRERLGWAMTCFVDARIPILQRALSEGNRERFEKMSYERKAAVVVRMVEKGLMT